MSRKTSRREFAAGIAVAAGALTLPEIAGAQQPKPNEALTATAQAMTDIIRARYGKHLSEEQLKRVQQKIRGNLLGAEALKRTRLENGDEPSFIFAVA
jgi:hypothetical protein